MIEHGKINFCLDQGDGGGDISYWEKKLGVSRSDPNFAWHIEQATANETEGTFKKIVDKLGLWPKAKVRIIGADEKLKLHHPK